MEREGNFEFERDFVVRKMITFCNEGDFFFKHYKGEAILDERRNFRMRGNFVSMREEILE